MGLVNRVVPKEDLEIYVKNYATTISANAPLTVHAVKYTINEAVKDESVRNLKHSAELVERCFASNDYAEGRKALEDAKRAGLTVADLDPTERAEFAPMMELQNAGTAPAAAAAQARAPGAGLSP